MNIKHLLVVKKPLTAVCVFLFTVFGIHSSYADYYPTGIQQDVSEQTLIDNGWTKFYEQTYGTPIGTSSTLIRPSEQYVILSGKAVDSTTILLAAAAPTDQVFTETVINTPQLLNGTYWYFTLNIGFGVGGSIGFAPTNQIAQGTADVQSASGSLRLSWHLEDFVGGYRIGTDTSLNSSTDYLKQVWSWDGTRAGPAPAPAPAPAPVFVRQSSNLSFAQSLYASDTLSDEDGQLRATVDQIMNKYGSLIK